jgi:hypothetical protein
LHYRQLNPPKQETSEPRRTRTRETLNETDEEMNKKKLSKKKTKMMLIATNTRSQETHLREILGIAECRIADSKIEIAQ